MKYWHASNGLKFWCGYLKGLMAMDSRVQSKASSTPMFFNKTYKWGVEWKSEVGQRGLLVDMTVVNLRFTCRLLLFPLDEKLKCLKLSAKWLKGCIFCGFSHECFNISFQKNPSAMELCLWNVLFSSLWNANFWMSAGWSPEVCQFWQKWSLSARMQTLPQKIQIPQIQNGKKSHKSI